MDYLWLSLLMAFLSIFLGWFWIQWRRKQDGVLHKEPEEDKSLTEDIKSNLNPDMLTRRLRKHACHGVVNHESNVTERCEDVEEIETERRIQREQLKQIFKLMENDKGKYGIDSMADVEEQMKRYKT